MKLADSEICTGCGACCTACPSRAILMKPDSWGFIRPFVDSQKCINCNLCKSVCPVLQTRKARNYSPLCFAARTKNRALLMASSSGGIFTELCHVILSSCGSVFGCVMENCIARHRCACDEDGLAQMRGSKYVQSDIGMSLYDCKVLLSNNKKVLFSGTPCQIAGLHSYLGRAYDNLITIALICHGVASPLSLQRYIAEEEALKKIKMVDIAFRDKKSRVGDISMTCRFVDGSNISYSWDNVYMRAFLDAYSYRPCCFKCQFRSGNCGADIIIGDFWGIERLSAEFNVKEGVSAVIINSEKGKAIFDILDVHKMPVRYEDIAKYNKNLDCDAVPPKNRRGFLAIVRDGGSMRTFFDKIDHVPMYKVLIEKAKDFLRPVYYRIKRTVGGGYHR